jgi:hypothetical protein
MTKSTKHLAAMTAGAVLAASLFLASPAKADDAAVLKYSGGKLVYAGIAEGIQFTVGQGFLSLDSQVFAFRDKCTGQSVRVIDDVVIKQSKDALNCADLPRPQ